MRAIVKKAVTVFGATIAKSFHADEQSRKTEQLHHHCAARESNVPSPQPFVGGTLA
jgi:hypothetical protein